MEQESACARTASSGVGPCPGAKQDPATSRWHTACKRVTAGQAQGGEGGAPGPRVISGSMIGTKPFSCITSQSASSPPSQQATFTTPKHLAVCLKHISCWLYRFAQH